MLLTKCCQRCHNTKIFGAEFNLRLKCSYTESLTQQGAVRPAGRPDSPAPNILDIIHDYDRLYQGGSAGCADHLACKSGNYHAKLPFQINLFEPSRVSTPRWAIFRKWSRVRRCDARHSGVGSFKLPWRYRAPQKASSCMSLSQDPWKCPLEDRWVVPFPRDCY
jgi:hypothetical protein